MEKFDSGLSGKDTFKYKDHDTNEDNADLNSTQADLKMNAFIKRIQSRAAIPEYALTDAVFCADRPNDAVSLGEEISTITLDDHFQVNTVVQITITEFWFRFENYIHETLDNLKILLHDFYSQSDKQLGNYCNHLPNFFIQPGYLCVAYNNVDCSWRRARIVSKPITVCESVSIYYLDYGSGAEVSRTQLRFLSKALTYVPAMAVRGCVSYIHPLGPHWPPESNREFERSVLNYHLYAHITELDSNERIVFMRISHNTNMKPSINKLMVIADLAGKSSHYSKRTREFHCGRRMRYLRERLPSFDMLENRVYPRWGDEFEHTFDDLICAPTFYKDFEVPNIKNPFLLSLKNALAAWLITYKKEEKIWRKLYKEADDKLMKEHFEQLLTLPKIEGDGKNPVEGMKSNQL